MKRRTLVRLAALAATIAAAVLFVLLSGYLSSPGAPSSLWKTDFDSMSVLKTGQFDNGHLKMTVSTPRVYAYRIGTPIAIEVVIAADSSATVSFDTLAAGVIARSGTDFEMVQPPVITQSTKDGKRVWTIDMVVRFWTAADPGPFSAEFLYSPTSVGGQPVWQYIATPPVQFHWSNTAPPGAKDIQQGPLDEKSQPFNVLGWLIFALAALLALSTPGYLARSWWRKRNQPCVPLKYETFWSTVDTILESARYSGLTSDHFQEIAALVRDFINVRSLTYLEVELALADDPFVADILMVLKELDQELYGHNPLTEEERAQLITELETLIPRNPVIIRKEKRSAKKLLKKLNPLTLLKRAATHLRRHHGA